MKDKLNKNHIIKFIIAIAVIVLISFPVFGKEMKPSPNYLIILVHGIGENNDVFTTRGYGDLENHLKNNLGLDGYVYRYAVKDRYDSNLFAAQQIGHTTEAETWFYNGNFYEKKGDIRWLSQAREDFKIWYAKDILHNSNHPELVPESVIPNKYIIIAHSMGGLAVRSYLTSDYYDNDVKKLITIDTPHLGADGVTWYKRYKNYDGAI